MNTPSVEVRKLLSQFVPCSSTRDAVPAETAGYRDGAVLIEPCQARRDRLVSLLESEWQTKVIALASVGEWLKLCKYVPASLVLLSRVDANNDAGRTDEIERLEASGTSAALYVILSEPSGAGETESHARTPILSPDANAVN